MNNSFLVSISDRFSAFFKGCLDSRPHHTIRVTNSRSRPNGRTWKREGFRLNDTLVTAIGRATALSVTKVPLVGLGKGFALNEVAIRLTSLLL